MNSLRALVREMDAATARGERCALATIVHVEGSSYRRIGARMLVAEGGACTGSVSPGCLEGDVVEQARRVMDTGVPTVVEYETSTTGTELPWGLGLGCGGTLSILVEPLAADSSYAAMLRLACDEGRNTHGLRVTTRYDADSVTHEAVLVAAGEASGDPVFETSPGVLVETLHAPVPLVVFGAGPDAVPLVELATKLGWRVEVVDPHARAASLDRFAMAHRVTLARLHELRERVSIRWSTTAVVMTHDYECDRALLELLLASPARYIGVMGPARRTKRMLQELNADDDATVERLHAPAGLDIGADGPEEVALSIVAELRAVLDGRSGGMLRDRTGGIHGSSADACTAAGSAR